MNDFVHAEKLCAALIGIISQQNEIDYMSVVLQRTCTYLI